MRPGSEELVGKTIAGKYQIVRLLGEGGMGTVYQARQVPMDRMVALKLIRPELVLTPEVAARFQQEMRVTAKIEHPNTVRLYDVGESEGRLFLAMEFLSGTPLTNVIAAGRLDLGRIVHISKQIAHALGAIHASGVVHRDLKPDNVILLESFGQRDFVKVLDFGVAKPLDESNPKLTTVGTVVGTPAYMAPEQALARPSDARADLYSLGIMIYEMACGTLPFAAPSTTSMLMAHATETPRPLQEVAPDVSPALAALVNQLLAKEPGARPQTVEELVARLDACIGGGATGAFAGTMPPKKKGVALWVVLGLLVVGGGAVAAVVATQGAGGGEARVADAGAGGAVAARAPDAAVVAVAVRAPDAGAQVAVAPPTRDAGAPAPASDAAAKPVAVTIDAAVVAVAPVDAAVAPVDAAPVVVRADRRELDALFSGAGDPPAPESCRASDAETIKRLEAAARAMFPKGDAFGTLAALGSTSDTAEEWALRARAELLGDANKALLSAEEALRLCPKYAVAHNLAGNALQKLGRFAQAEEAYSQALYEVASYDAPRFNLGLSQLRRKDKAAVWTFTELIKRRPDYPNVFLVRAQAHLLGGKADDALADLEEAVRRQPKSVEAWMALGQLREHLDKGDAHAAYCEAKKLGNAEGAKRCPE